MCSLFIIIEKITCVCDFLFSVCQHVKLANIFVSTLITAVILYLCLNLNNCRNSIFMYKCQLKKIHIDKNIINYYIPPPSPPPPPPKKKQL